MNLSRVAIHGVPRSGTSWLGELFNSSPNTIYKFQPLFSYALKDFLDASSSSDSIEEFFYQLELSKDEFLDQTKNRMARILPTFNKGAATHLVYKEVRYHHVLRNLMEKDTSLRVVGLVRDPRAIIASWTNAPREFRSELGWKVAEEWRFAAKKNLERVEEFYGFEKWKSAVKIFESLAADFPDRFYLLQYEKLLKNARVEVEDIFSWSGLNWNRQTEEFIQASKRRNHPSAYSVFREPSPSCRWQSGLDPKIAKEIEREARTEGLQNYLVSLVEE